LAAQDAPVRFVAYNLKNYLPMERSVEGQKLPDAPKPDAEIKVVLATLADLKPDLLGVCEIGGSAEVDDLKQRLRWAGVDLPHHEWVDAADAERHLALLSRFPIVARNSARDLVYRLGDTELPVQRGILDVTVEPRPGYRLRCLGVHFKSKREVPEGDQALMRRHEADLLRKHADAILAADPDTNLLVYGDLNDSRNEPAIRAVQGAGNTPGHLATIYLKDRFGMSWTHHWDFANLYSRIDYILFNDALRPEIVFDQCLVHWRDDWEQGSDHRALLAVISPADRSGKPD
jgi:endonuclease/exonuclease/phosphatase family metal-dependent hydrolase